jgi:hypothetical protein
MQCSDDHEDRSEDLQREDKDSHAFA